MAEIPDLNRRTYVGSLIAAGAIAAGAPAAISAGGDDDDGDDENDQSGQSNSDGDDDKNDQSEQPKSSDGIPAAHPFIGDLDGDDLSGDMEFDVESRYDGDQAVQKNDAEEGDRDWVVHYTTQDDEGKFEETQDYPAALINLHERLDKDVTLDELATGKLTFDYYVGKEHGQYIPGQVYLVIQTRKQKKDNRAWGLYKNVRRGAPRDRWATLDVIEEMEGEGAPESGPWRALEIDVDPDGFRGEFGSFSDAILEQAISTREEEGETFEDVFDKYGDKKGPMLLAMGLGSGSSRTATQRDIYYDDYRINVGDVDETFELPAALRMDADFDTDGQITATLSFDIEPENVDLDDLDEDSVRLYPFSQIMPPLDEGAEPNQIDVDDDGIEVQFPSGQVRRLSGLGTGEQRVVVAGQFDYEHVVWFYGVGEVNVPGN
jgi:hypothetical protein